MKTITAQQILKTSVTIPGSKSISHRALICAALADGTSLIRNSLESEDIRHTMTALSCMGAGFAATDQGDIVVTGINGRPAPWTEPVYLGNSGTSMRLLAGIAGLGNTDYILTGDDRMQERPIQDLLDALCQVGVAARSIHGTGAPPVLINGISRKGGTMNLDCSQSSQYLSSVLMMGPILPLGLEILLPAPAVSAPYVNLTLDMMRKFGVSAERYSDTRYMVPGSQTYSAVDLVIEPDVSNASYFWAAGAITGQEIKVSGISKESRQGDLRLLDILRMMGCRVNMDSQGISVSGQELIGVDVDMSDIPDVVPTLAVIAAFARGTTRMRNIAHLRAKECDRIDAVVSQLQKMNVPADQGEDWLSVTGCNPRGAVIDTFNDHRIAMAFSVAGLRVQGMGIRNPGCVAKSFPAYWELFESLAS